MRRPFLWFHVILLALAAGMIAGCQMSPFVVEEAQTIVEKDLVAARALLESERKAFAATIEGSRHKAHLGHTVEKNDVGYGEAEKALASVEQGCAAQLKGYVERNKAAEQAEAQKAIEVCKGAIEKLNKQIAGPQVALRNWELLASSPGSLRDGVGKARQVLAQSGAELAEEGALRLRLDQALQTWPNKREDLTARQQDILGLMVGLEQPISEIEGGLAKLQSGEVTDLKALSFALLSLLEKTALVEFALQDLAARLDELGTSHEVILVGLERSPASNTATIRERKNGIELPSSSTVIDLDTLYEYYHLAKELHELFPEAGILDMKHASSVLDEQKVPVTFSAELQLVLEQKLEGQYEEQTSISPALLAFPLALVGLHEFGQWIGEDDESEWEWDPFWRTHWFGVHGRYHKHKSHGFWGKARRLGVIKKYDSWKHKRGYGTSKLGDRGYYASNAYAAGDYKKGWAEAKKGSGKLAAGSAGKAPSYQSVVKSNASKRASTRAAAARASSSSIRGSSSRSSGSSSRSSGGK